MTDPDSRPADDGYTEAESATATSAPAWFADDAIGSGLPRHIIDAAWNHGTTRDGMGELISLHWRGCTAAELLSIVESGVLPTRVAQVLDAGGTATDAVRWWTRLDVPLTLCARLLAIGRSADDIDTVGESGVLFADAIAYLSVEGTTVADLTALHADGIDAPAAAHLLAAGGTVADAHAWGRLRLDLHAIAAAYPAIAGEPDPEIRDAFAVFASQGMTGAEAAFAARVLGPSAIGPSTVSVDDVPAPQQPAPVPRTVTPARAHPGTTTPEPAARPLSL